jgi:hypothetical protein
MEKQQQIDRKNEDLEDIYAKQKLLEEALAKLKKTENKLKEDLRVLKMGKANID